MINKKYVPFPKMKNITDVLNHNINYRLSDNKKMLLIDSNEQVLFTLAHHLHTEYNYDIVIAMSPADIMRELRNEIVYDLIISDIRIIDGKNTLVINSRIDIPNIHMHNARTPLILTDEPHNKIIDLNMYYLNRNIYQITANQYVNLNKKNIHLEHSGYKIMDNSIYVNYYVKMRLIDDIIKTHKLINIDPIIEIHPNDLVINIPIIDTQPPATVKHYKKIVRV